MLRCALTMNSNDPAVPAPPLEVVMTGTDRNEMVERIARAIAAYAQVWRIAVTDVGYTQAWSSISIAEESV